MGHSKKFDTSYLRERINASFSANEFAQAMNVGEGRLSQLLEGTTEFKQSEMLCAARLLRLDREAFERCFFTIDVQKI